MYVIIAIIINITLSCFSFYAEKENSKWLEKAKEAYTNNMNTLFYPRSEIALRKKYHLYAAAELRTIIGAWLITIVLPFFVSDNIFLLIYILNFLYGRILYFLAIIEQKVEVIKDEVYKENDDL